MTDNYFQNRATEIMRDPLLLPLVSLVLGVPQADCRFFIRNEPVNVEGQVISYLKGGC